MLLTQSRIRLDMQIDVQQLIIDQILHYEETMPHEVRIAREDSYRFLLHDAPEVSYSRSELLDVIKDWILTEDIKDIVIKLSGDNPEDGEYMLEIPIHGSADNIIENLFPKLYKYIKD